MRSIVLVPVLALAAASTVSAQVVAQGREAVPDQRGYVSVHGGAVAGLPAAPAFAVEYGDNFHRNGQAYVALSYFENLMKQTLRDDLSTLGTDLSTLTGTPWDLQGRDRGVALVGGGKYLLGSGNVRPYLGGGAGIISLRRTVTEARLGDVRAAIFNDFSVGEVDLSLAPASLTRPLVEAAFGVGIVKGNTYFDIGYRYRRAFRLADNLDFSQLSVGIGYKF
jgi:opacity protein-like surface antigen